MHLVIISPQGLLCDSVVEKVSFPGSVGSFTVLKDHAPMVAGLKEGEIVYTSNGRAQRVYVRTGYVHVLDNEIEACVETGVAKEKK